MSFEPRLALARSLGQTRRVTAMIDLSDGLSRDLAHICRESNVGAVLNAAAVPVHSDVTELAGDGHSPLQHALHDGEDYELLFTAPKELTGAAWTRIGETTAEPGLFLRHADGRCEPLKPKAWEHQF
jgi:thiamine-monophosphate kinase